MCLSTSENKSLAPDHRSNKPGLRTAETQNTGNVESRTPRYLYRLEPAYVENHATAANPRRTYVRNEEQHRAPLRRPGYSERDRPVTPRQVYERRLLPWIYMKAPFNPTWKNRRITETDIAICQSDKLGPHPRRDRRGRQRRQQRHHSHSEPRRSTVDCSLETTDLGIAQHSTSRTLYFPSLSRGTQPHFCDFSMLGGCYDKWKMA